MNLRVFYLYKTVGFGWLPLSMRILCKRVLIEVLIMASLWKRICPTRLSKGK